MILDRNYIEQLAFDVNSDAFVFSFEKIKERLEIAISNIMEKNAFITGYCIEPANEALTGAETVNSTLDLYLELSAPLIEKNLTEQSKNKFKFWLKKFFSEFKRNLKLFSKKNKSQKNMLKTERKINQSKNYTIEHLYRDIQIQLSKVHYKTSKIQLFANKIQINDQNEYASDINIYPIILSNGAAKQYVLGKSKAKIINFKARFNNIESMHDVTDNMSLVQLRVLNSIFYKIFNRIPNQVFIESLIYNVPIEMFADDVYETTINVFNFLKNSAIQNFVSVCDINTNLFKDEMNTETLDIAIKFIRTVNFE